MKRVISIILLFTAVATFTAYYSQDTRVGYAMVIGDFLKSEQVVVFEKDTYLDPLGEETLAGFNPSIERKWVTDRTR